jgi:acyl carrier protein
MAIPNDEIFQKVQAVLVDALGVDEEEVTPTAKIKNDLGAESIDLLDITFRLEKQFGFKMNQNELVPDLQKDSSLMKDGKVTPAGIAMLRERLPTSDIATFEADPRAENIWNLITVNVLVDFVQRKLAQAQPAA